MVFRHSENYEEPLFVFAEFEMERYKGHTVTTDITLNKGYVDVDDNFRTYSSIEEAKDAINERKREHG